MRKAADAVIIGGGALGTSILHHLTAKGLRNVVLLEKGGICSGSTGDSAALVRQHYSNEVSVRLVKKSLEIFQHFPEVFDGTEVLHNVGWYFLVPPEAADLFHDNMAQLKRLGVRTWEISLEEAAEALPGLNMEGIGCVAHEPDSGYVDPHGMVSTFAAKAKTHGAQVYLQTPARDIKLSNDRVSAVVTDQGEISTPVVVNAAGPWAKAVGQWVGLDLPLEVTRESEVVARIPGDIPPVRHSVSNMVDRTYWRPERRGMLLVGVGHPKENELTDPDQYSRDVSRDFVEDVARRLSHRIPAMEEAMFVKGWSGLYTVTPDWNMILDKSHDVEGLYLAVGGSGHSFKISPAIGLCMAELIADGAASTVDITPLRAERFTEQTHLSSTYGGNRA
jgi:sarcosine oxidase subunit beta